MRSSQQHWRLRRHHHLHHSHHRNVSIRHLLSDATLAERRGSPTPPTRRPTTPPLQGPRASSPLIDSMTQDCRAGDGFGGTETRRFFSPSPRPGSRAAADADHIRRRGKRNRPPTSRPSESFNDRLMTVVAYRTSRLDPRRCAAAAAPTVSTPWAESSAVRTTRRPARRTGRIHFRIDFSRSRWLPFASHQLRSAIDQCVCVCVCVCVCLCV